MSKENEALQNQMKECGIFETLLDLAKKRVDDPARASAIECVGTLVVNSGLKNKKKGRKRQKKET